MGKFPGRLERFGRGHAGNLEMAGYLEELAAGRAVVDPSLPDVFLERVDTPSTTTRRGDRVEARKRAKKLRGCASWLHFQHYYTVDVVRLAGGRFCQQGKLCANCARRRGAKLMRRYVERVLVVQATNAQLVGYLLTVTAKDRPELRGMHDHLWGNFQEWIALRRHHLKNPKRNRYTALCEFAGGVVAGEVKRGSGSGLWHEHLHAAVLGPRMTPERVQELAAELAAEWYRLTGDSYIVDLRPFHYVQQGLAVTADNLCRDFVEVFKYQVKLNDLAPEDRWHAHQVLAGAHMLRPFGCLYGVEVPEDLLDDDLEESDLPYVDWFYRYAGDGTYRLEHHNADSHFD